MTFYVSLIMKYRLLLLLSFCISHFSFAQTDQWSTGAAVGINFAALRIHSNTGPSVLSSVQATPVFGIYFRSPMEKRFLIEFRGTYESTGMNKQVFYERVQNEWVSINDRYNTVAIGALLYFRPFGAERFRLGGGLKSHFVISSKVRNGNQYPQGASGPVFFPVHNKWFAAGSVELMYSWPEADVCVNFSPGITSLIYSEGIEAVPAGASVTFKKHIAVGTRSRDM